MSPSFALPSPISKGQWYDAAPSPLSAKSAQQQPSVEIEIKIVKVVPYEDRLVASFVLAFLPESVSRPILRLAAEKNDEYAEVEIQNSQATIITGACIAWQYLNANGINMSDFLESQNK